MKSTKNFRGQHPAIDADVNRKPTKLDPIKKSGKDRHFFIDNYDSQDVQDDLTEIVRKRESAYDYYDDLSEGENMAEDELVDLMEDEWEDARDRGDDYQELPLEEQLDDPDDQLPTNG